jgi:hypothetical protein
MLKRSASEFLKLHLSFPKSEENRQSTNVILLVQKREWLLNPKNNLDFQPDGYGCIAL